MASTRFLFLHNIHFDFDYINLLFYLDAIKTLIKTDKRKSTKHKILIILTFLLYHVFFKVAILAQKFLHILKFII